MFTSYGYSTMIKVLLLCMGISAAAMIFPFGAEISLLLLAASLLLFTLYFFRDPKRTAPDEKRIILAPADGGGKFRWDGRNVCWVVRRIVLQKLNENYPKTIQDLNEAPATMRI